ncbi:MAG: S46 family peptidase [Deltaproteobacteria bacterium]|nr:S46 family peptidase [Deltaproteobacteria bacterium]
MRSRFAAMVVLFVGAFVAVHAAADEGMWTFDNPPLDKIEKAFGMKMSKEWLDHLRLSSVRLAGIGSASFVSKDGLILTNHHVAADCIQQISTEENDLMKNGYGANGEAPLRCPGSEAQVLVETRDVTRRVQDAVPAGQAGAAAFEARKAETARIESECANATSDLCEVVSLYQGSEYWLHIYRTYKDVRLVWAPEGQAAMFGGDPDNFNFPRYSLDAALMRAYDEAGNPVTVTHHLRVAPGAYRDGDPVFVSGHPTSSGRFYTYAQLEFLRDSLYPLWLTSMERSRDVFREYTKRGEEQKRRALFEIGMDENFIKVAIGYMQGLRDGELMKRAKDAEDELRAKVAADPKLAEEIGDPWGEIAKAQELHRAYFKRFRYVRMRGSDAFDKARQIVLLTAELQKPNEERFEEFRDSALPSLYSRLYSKAPLYADMEEVVLADRLAQLAENLGEDDPAVKAALGGRTPAKVAADAIAKTKIFDADARKALVEQGRAGVEKSKDPLIRLALALEPEYRALRTRYEHEVEEVEAQAGDRIARARFAIRGREIYPDTTFTLRLSYGRVSGYEDHGYMNGPRTTFYGLFERAESFGNKPPYDVAPGFDKARGLLDLSTTYNFVATLDTFPGNSGSPIVNGSGDLVGLLFDGNLPGLSIQFVYDERIARSIAVDIEAVLEALRVVYGRGDLAREMLSGAAK